MLIPAMGCETPPPGGSEFMLKKPEGIGALEATAVVDATEGPVETADGMEGLRTIAAAGSGPRVGSGPRATGRPPSGWQGV